MMNKKKLIMVSVVCGALLVPLVAFAFNSRTTPSVQGAVPQPVSLGLAILQRTGLSREAYLEAAVNIMTGVFAPNGFIPYPGQDVSEADSFFDVFVTDANATVVELDRLIRDTIIAPEALDVALRLHDILVDSLNAIIDDSTCSIETEPYPGPKILHPYETIIMFSNITSIPYVGEPEIDIKVDIKAAIETQGWGVETLEDMLHRHYRIIAWRDNDKDGYLGVSDEIMVQCAYEYEYEYWATIKEDIAAIFEPGEPMTIKLYCSPKQPVIFTYQIEDIPKIGGIPPKYAHAPIIVVYQIPIRCLNWPGFDTQVRQPEVDEKEGVVTKRWESFVVTQKVSGMALFRAWYRWPDPIHGPHWLCGAAWLPAEYICTTIVTPGMTPTVEIIEQTYAIPELGEFIWFFKKDP